jgi:hypothetical protein
MQAAAGLLLSAFIAAPVLAADDAVTTAPADAVATADAQDPAPAPTPSPEQMAMSFLKMTEISGFVDMYYQYNFNKTAPALRSFDITHNSFSLNLAEVALEKKPTADSRAGFRIDLDYGQAAAIVHSAEPVPGAAAIFQNLEQAYVSYLAPAGTGLQLDFGKFVTPLGYEVIESKDNWNYSRSLLFQLAIPLYHMGARATYSPNDKVTIAGYLVNGWNDTVDNNSGKTGIFSLTLKPTAAFSLIENYIGGPETTATNKGFKQVSDTVATLTATKKVSLAGNFDYGKQAAVLTTPNSTWWGVAGYARFQPNDMIAITPRVEYYDDKNGFTTGAVQKLKEGTLTYEAKTKEGFITRLEYRHDMSDVPFFTKSGVAKKNQDTFTVGIIYAFSSMH